MILVQLLVVHRPFDRPSHSSSKASLIELETDGGVGCDEAVYGFGYEMEDDPQPLVEALERNLLANEVDEFVHGELGGEGGDLELLGGEGDLEDGLEADEGGLHVRDPTIDAIDRFESLEGQDLGAVVLEVDEVEQATLGVY